MAYDATYFSRALKSKRALKGWNQSDLAEHSDVSRDSIARYEMGLNAPSFEAACKLASALDCKTDDFWQHEAA